jgi:hypothetical protein
MNFISLFSGIPRGIAEEHITSLQRKVTTGPTRGKIEIQLVPLSIRPSRCLNVLTNIEVEQRYPYGKQQSVFVGDVQSVQTPKRIIPSPVWLKRADHGFCILMDVFYLAFKPLLIFLESGLLIRDRERSETARLFTVYPDEGTNQIIESGSEVLEHVPGDQWHLIRNNPRLRNVINWLSCLRIDPPSDSNRVRGGKRLDHGVEFLDMLFGPLDL